MNTTTAEGLGSVATSQGLAAWLGRGIAKALLAEPSPSQSTEADETFWLVPEIDFGPLQLPPKA